MDWKVERVRLRTATIAAVDALASSLEDQRPYAICLQTSDDGMSVGLCANTEEGYAEKYASEATIEDMTPEHSTYLRWAPAEWRYEMVKGNHFTDINRDLTAVSLHSDEEFSSHFDHLIDAMIDALAHLRAERTLALEGVTLFVTISDSNEAEAIENASASRINPADLAGRFLSRFD